jgi:hypothetical protein
MRQAITIGFDSAGNSRVLHGAEVSIKDQLLACVDYKAGAIPAGLVRVERWTSDKGREMIAVARTDVAPVEKKKKSQN